MLLDNSMKQNPPVSGLEIAQPFSPAPRGRRGRWSGFGQIISVLLSKGNFKHTFAFQEKKNMVESNVSDYRQVDEKPSASMEQQSENRQLDFLSINDGHRSSGSYSPDIAASAVAATDTAMSGKILPGLIIDTDKIQDSPQTLSRDDLVNVLKKSGAAVHDAISQLPKEMQVTYAFLENNNKDGTFSQAQLDFIFEKCGKVTYELPRVHDDTLHMLEKLLDNHVDKVEFKPGEPETDKIENKKPLENEGTRSLSSDKLGQQMTESAAVVREAISQLPQEMQAKYASLENNRDGTFSQNQLSFIKSHCDMDTFSAARDYNRAYRAFLDQFSKS